MKQLLQKLVWKFQRTWGGLRQIIDTPLATPTSHSRVQIAPFQFTLLEFSLSLVHILT